MNVQIVASEQARENMVEGNQFRDSTLRLRGRIHEMLVQKKTRSDIAKMLQTEFHWVQLHLDRGLDGAMAELQ